MGKPKVFSSSLSENIGWSEYGFLVQVLKKIFLSQMLTFGDSAASFESYNVLYVYGSCACIMCSMFMDPSVFVVVVKCFRNL